MGLGRRFRSLYVGRHMEWPLLILLLTAVTATVVATAAIVRLRRTRGELRRARVKIQRLEAAAQRWMESPIAPEDRMRSLATPAEPPAQLQPEREETSTPIGLQFDSSSLFDDEFAAPRMAVDGTRKAGRERSDTALGSPRRMTPKTAFSVVEVGKIQVRMDGTTEPSDD